MYLSTNSGINDTIDKYIRYGNKLYKKVRGIFLSNPKIHISNVVIGDIGEYAAARFLREDGFKLMQYGKTIKSKKLSQHKTASLPVAWDNLLNCPFEKIDMKIFGEGSKDFLDRFADIPPYENDFIHTNLMVDQYIKRYYSRFCEVNRKNNTKYSINAFPGNTSHPGRYDFIAYKNEAFSAIEVKVNSSRINYWQIIRLALLQRYKCSAYILNVLLSKDQISLAACGEEPEVSEVSEVSEINIINQINTTTVELPSDIEFLEVLRFRSSHERFTQPYSATGSWW